MAKKQKKATPERVPTKRQLSTWQRQMKIRRIVIIAAIVFLAGISSWVGYEYYEDYKAGVAPLREVVIEVNGVPFTMEYFVKMLDAYTTAMNSTVLSYYGNYLANITADYIINAEVLRQGAESLNITVTTAEVDARLKEARLPNDSVYRRDMVRAILLPEKLKREYFGPRLPDIMEQAHVQVVLVESQEVAAEVITKIEADSNFTALVEGFSCNSSIEGDLGQLPRELMPNIIIANAAFNLTPGEIKAIYDETAVKDVGYWLIEVTKKQDNEIEARAMLLGSKAEAEQVKAELLAGGNFSSLAKKYSQHKSKDEGGELGWLKQGDMRSKDFDQVAFNMTVNQVSEPVKDESVQTTGGCWVVKVIDRGMYELDETTRAKLTDKHLNDWFEEWKRNSIIENLLTTEKIQWAVSKVLERR